MKKAIVNDNHSFEIEVDGDAIFIDGARIEPDISEIAESHYHLIVSHKGYRIEIVDRDEENKSAVISINGKICRVQLKDENDRLLENLGIEGTPITTIKDLKSPMPGMVLDVLVTPGQHVKKGDHLLILEAMKMENLIKSPSDLIVNSVEVNKGDKIEKSQTLLYFE